MSERLAPDTPQYLQQRLGPVEGCGTQDSPEKREALAGPRDQEGSKGRLLPAATQATFQNTEGNISCHTKPHLASPTQALFIP